VPDWAAQSRLRSVTRRRVRPSSIDASLALWKSCRGVFEDAELGRRDANVVTVLVRHLEGAGPVLPEAFPGQVRAEPIAGAVLQLAVPPRSNMGGCAVRPNPHRPADPAHQAAFGLPVPTPMAVFECAIDPPHLHCPICGGCSGMPETRRDAHAVWARCARPKASGPAPSSAVSRRVRCRGAYPRRWASPGTPSRSTTPLAMSRTARAVVSPRGFYAGDPGAALGRASLAHAVPGLVRGRARLVERDVRLLGRARGAARTAVDAGRADGRQELPVEPGIGRLDDAVPLVEDIDVMVSRTGAVLLMSPSPTRHADTGWRKADTTVKASARGGP
jgi:hypothetical protein